MGQQHWHDGRIALYPPLISHNHEYDALTDQPNPIDLATELTVA